MSIRLLLGLLLLPCQLIGGIVGNGLRGKAGDRPARSWFRPDRGKRPVNVPASSVDVSPGNSDPVTNPLLRPRVHPFNRPVNRQLVDTVPDDT